MVWDEPFYAHYLAHTGLDHPGAADIIATYETDWRKIVERLIGQIPGDKRILYQKHMTHHLLPHLERNWLKQVTNCFLIRDPAEVLLSLAKVLPHPTLQDTGFPQQAEIFTYLCDTCDTIPPVLDAADVLTDASRMLQLLCHAIGVEFSDRMLAWPAGQRPSDGIWAKYWYAAVEQSTGFQPYQPNVQPIPASLQDLYEAALGSYQLLYPHRLT
jgi:hypothetical protein